MVVFAYFSKDLPSPHKLSTQQQALSTEIYDRNGTSLYNIYGEENRTLVDISDIPESLINATLATEDADFYRHRGFDLRGIFRAVYQIAFKHKLQGGSTITQQLVKNTLLTPERTITRKIREFVLALQIEKKYSKEQILQMYFNESPYGGQAWGVEAASKMYFDKSVKDITPVEATLLAGMPQSPTRYSPIANPETAEDRRSYVIHLMQTSGWWDKDGRHKFLSKEEAEKLLADRPEVKVQVQNIKAPHFVMYVRQLLTERYGVKLVEQGGLKVTTTLDLERHDKMQEFVREEVEKAAPLLVGNGALVALNPQTGEVLSMVGSLDYFDIERDGNVNVTLAKRQPGSAIKPVNYVTAFKKGYTAASMVVDTETTFPGGEGLPDYVPENYDGEFRGPMQFRYTLANSINVAAVKVLKLVGIRSMLQTAYDMGLSTLAPTEENLNRFGLSLTLGGGEVTLLELTSAFGVFANGGVRMAPEAILKVVDSKGNVLEEFRPTQGRRVLNEEYAYIICDILSENEARSGVFGYYSPLNISGYTVAVKTGTTDDKRDNWTIGYTPSIVIGVWVGNNDNTPMHPKLASGITGAAPIWNRAIQDWLQGKEDELFKKPEGIMEAKVDKLSGMKPGPFSATRTEIFAKGTVPTQEDDMHVALLVCEDGELVNDACIEADEYEEKDFIILRAALPEWQHEVDEWVKAVHGDDEEWNPPKEESESYFNPSGEEEPWVKIEEPDEDGEAVGTKFEVKVKVITPYTVTKVEFYINDALFATKTSIPYKQTFNLTEGSQGKHVVLVKGYDSAGNVGSGSREVIVGSMPLGTF